ncbi:hypothetical protein KM043_000042, partial [Ampulex compressa]
SSSSSHHSAPATAIERKCRAISRAPQVRAYDADTPPYNDQVRYFLSEGDKDLFRINASTGHIFLLRPLDRELLPEYTLTLVAMDT